MQINIFPASIFLIMGALAAVAGIAIHVLNPDQNILTMIAYSCFGFAISATLLFRSGVAKISVVKSVVYAIVFAMATALIATLIFTFLPEKSVTALLFFVVGSGAYCTAIFGTDFLIKGGGEQGRITLYLILFYSLLLVTIGELDLPTFARFFVGAPLLFFIFGSHRHAMAFVIKKQLKGETE